MKQREAYNTKQKNLILNVIKKHDKEFTIKDIYNELNKEIGLTTIYRMVDKLVIDGKLNKSIGSNNVTYYNYLEECDRDNHFYLKCNSCGNMIHIDCDCIGELTNHIYKEHKFSMSKDHIIINGLCEKCINRGK